jgi:hypothetical protein
MERTVVRRRGTRTLSRALMRLHGRERERKTGRLQNMPAPVEMRLQKLRGRR